MSAKRRREETHAAKVRATVTDRDPRCRAAMQGVGPCDGHLEWAHLGDKRRCFTRGMAPEARHSTAWTAMFCSGHHRRYDAHHFEVEYLTDHGADGAMRCLPR